MTLFNYTLHPLGHGSWLRCRVSIIRGSKIIMGETKQELDLWPTFSLGLATLYQLSHCSIWYLIKVHNEEVESSSMNLVKAY